MSPLAPAPSGYPQAATYAHRDAYAPHNNDAMRRGVPVPSVTGFGGVGFDGGGAPPTVGQQPGSSLQQPGSSLQSALLAVGQMQRGTGVGVSQGGNAADAHMMAGVLGRPGVLNSHQWGNLVSVQVNELPENVRLPAVSNDSALVRGL